MANLDYSNKQYVKQSQLGIPIGNKVVLGELTSYKDGTAKWTYAKDTNPIIAGPGDRSTFTLYKDDNGKWNWTPTTSTSVSNLANREGFTEQQVKDSLYKTPQTQTVLNAGNVTQLGGIKEAQKLGVPGTSGKSTQVGTLPSTVSGNFAGQPDATTANQQPAKPTLDSAALEKTIGDGISRSSYGRLIYPLDLEKSKQDKIKFDILKYVPRGVTTGITQKGGEGGFGLSERPTERNILGTIFLPISGGISDTNTAGWGDSQPMNAFELALAESALAGIQGGLEQTANKLGTAAGNVGSDPEANKETKAALQGTFAALATQGNAAQLLSRTQGAVLNPNLELLFSGPELRSFSFTFKMSARSQQEANVIVQIIRAFKQAMSVQKTQGGLFLKAPNTFAITYLSSEGDGKPHKKIGRIKECALLSLTTNYTPEGQYATYLDGTMVSYEIQMQFKELEPIVNSDYPNDNSIGF